MPPIKAKRLTPMEKIVAARSSPKTPDSLRRVGGGGELSKTYPDGFHAQVCQKILDALFEGHELPECLEAAEINRREWDDWTRVGWVKKQLRRLRRAQGIKSAYDVLQLAKDVANGVIPASDAAVSMKGFMWFAERNVKEFSPEYHRARAQAEQLQVNTQVNLDVGGVSVVESQIKELLSKDPTAQALGLPTTFVEGLDDDGNGIQRMERVGSCVDRGDGGDVRVGSVEGSDEG